jgi:hypothetical protein
MCQRILHETRSFHFLCGKMRERGARETSGGWERLVVGTTIGLRVGEIVEACGRDSSFEPSSYSPSISSPSPRSSTVHSSPPSTPQISTPTCIFLRIPNHNLFFIAFPTQTLAKNRKQFNFTSFLTQITSTRGF